MSFIRFENLSFAYPPLEGDLDSEGKQIIPLPVFENASFELPSGWTSLIGPNGSGKSTFMLLASGRLKPLSGKAFLFDKDTSLYSEEELQNTASFVYQNMEFENTEKVSDLLSFVYHQGLFKGKTESVRKYKEEKDFFEECLEVFELFPLFEKEMKNLSKGEMQRVIASFSILYGSPSVFMDEPFFAMEEKQKEKALSYLKDYSEKKGISIFVSMHDIDLSRKYSDTVLLFGKDRTISYGKAEKLLSNESLEKAYGIPASMLKMGEKLTREELERRDEEYKKIMNQK